LWLGPNSAGAELVEQKVLTLRRVPYTKKPHRKRVRLEGLT